MRGPLWTATPGLEPGTVACGRLRPVCLVERERSVRLDPDPEAGTRTPETGTLVRVRALDDLRELGDGYDGRTRPRTRIHEHGDMRVHRNPVCQRALALVPLVVVVRDWLTGPQSLVLHGCGIRRDPSQDQAGVDACDVAAPDPSQRPHVPEEHELARAERAVGHERGRLRRDGRHRSLRRLRSRRKRNDERTKHHQNHRQRPHDSSLVPSKVRRHP